MNKTKIKEYHAPEVFEYTVYSEGVLCVSGAGNESYGADPGEDDSIF